MQVTVFSVVSRLRKCICFAVTVESSFCLELTLVPMDALQQCPLSRWFIRAEPVRMPSACHGRLCALLVHAHPSEA